jgi:hypothetical protein
MFVHKPPVRQSPLREESSRCCATNARKLCNAWEVFSSERHPLKHKTVSTMLTILVMAGSGFGWVGLTLNGARGSCRPFVNAAERKGLPPRLKPTDATSRRVSDRAAMAWRDDAGPGSGVM